MDLTSKQTKKIKFTKPLGSGQQKNKELMKAYLSRFFHENCFYMIIILFFYVVICSRLSSSGFESLLKFGYEINHVERKMSTLYLLTVFGEDYLLLPQKLL